MNIAGTNIGGKFYIACEADNITPTAYNDPLLKDIFSSLNWVNIPHLGNLGDTGTDQNTVSYSRWDSQIALQQKGVATGKQLEARFLDEPSNGMTAIKTAAKTSDLNNYLFKVEWKDGRTEYDRGLVSSNLFAKGQNEDFSESVFTLTLNGLEEFSDVKSILSSSNGFLFAPWDQQTVLVDTGVRASVNDPIMYISDYAGSNVRATQIGAASTQPTLEQDANGFRYINLDGTTQFFDLENLSAAAGDHTFVIALESASIDNLSHYLFDSQGSFILSQQDPPSNSAYPYNGSQPGFYTTANGWQSWGAPSPNLQILTYRFSGSKGEIRRNGISFANLAYTATALGGVIRLFADKDAAGNFFAGKCYGYFYIDRALSYGELKNVERLLSSYCGISGFYTKSYVKYLAIGDSITYGVWDQRYSDDNPSNKLITSLGYSGPLTEQLGISLDQRLIVANEGIPGETTQGRMGHINNDLIRHPDTKYAFINFGANDARFAFESGKGLSTGEAGYAGSYKGYMQQLIDKCTANRIQPYLAKTNYSRYYFPTPDRRTRVQDYNIVVDELIAANNIPIPPPNFYGFFEQRSHFGADSSGFTVTASSVETGFPVTNILDIDGATYWKSASTDTPPFTIDFDFGASLQVDGVTFSLAQTDALADMINNYKIYKSADGASWTLVQSGSFVDNNIYEYKPLNVLSFAERYMRFEIVSLHNTGTQAGINSMEIHQNAANYLMHDRTHPTGDGYHAMADIWDAQISLGKIFDGQDGFLLLPQKEAMVWKDEANYYLANPGDTIDAIYDVSNNHHNAIVSGATLQTTDGYNELVLDGIDDYLDLSAVGDLNGQTWTFVVAMNTSDTTGAFPTNGDTAYPFALSFTQGSSITNLSQGSVTLNSVYVDNTLRSPTTRGDVYTLINGSHITMLEFTVAQAWNALSFGNSPLAGGWDLGCNLRGLMLINKSFTEAERNQVYSYLSRVTGFLFK